MVIRAVHCRAHQIGRAGIHTDVFFINMLLMDRLRHKRSVGGKHEPAHLGIDRDVPQSRRNKDLLIRLANALSDHADIVRGILGTIGNAHSAG